MHAIHKHTFLGANSMNITAWKKKTYSIKKKKKGRLLQAKQCNLLPWYTTKGTGFNERNINGALEYRKQCLCNRPQEINTAM